MGTNYIASSQDLSTVCSHAASAMRTLETGPATGHADSTGQARLLARRGGAPAERSLSLCALRVREPAGAPGGRRGRPRRAIERYAHPSTAPTANRLGAQRAHVRTHTRSGTQRK